MKALDQGVGKYRIKLHGKPEVVSDTTFQGALVWIIENCPGVTLLPIETPVTKAGVKKKWFLKDKAFVFHGYMELLR